MREKNFDYRDEELTKRSLPTKQKYIILFFFQSYINHRFKVAANVVVYYVDICTHTAHMLMLGM